ncbi:MAG: endolytic transglycosylase MltG [Acidobacteria bacterium]|nr:endolytic transglycosylase MltG [Acidobacteriota bacterium]
MLLAVLAAGALGVSAWWLVQGDAALREEAYVDIPPGASSRQIAQMLAEAGVVRWPMAFHAVRILRPKAKLQAGEYRFFQPANAWTVFDRISRGDIFFYEVTIPEGSNIFDIGEILEQREILAAKEFVEVARDPAPIRDLSPQAPSLEGYLFPATYRLTKHTTAAQFARDMTQRFRVAWKQLHPDEGVDIHRIVTMGSLIEKETGVGAERAMVASVFENRLERGMKLDCDPTTIYAALLDGRYRGTIYRSDLDSKHPYNTYQHEGLPPGPVANPGMKSLEAALRPAQSAFLYFVAKPDRSGGHVFTTNVNSHNKAVGEYRRGQQKGKAPVAAPAGTRNRKTNGD